MSTVHDEGAQRTGRSGDLWTALKLLGASAAFERGDEKSVSGFFRSSSDQVHPIAGLSAAERLALVLCQGIGMAPAEAARTTGIDEAEIGRHLANASARLGKDSDRRAIVLEDAWLSRKTLEDACRRQGVEVVCSTAECGLAIAAASLYRVGLALIDLDLNGDPLAGEIVALKLRESMPDCRIVLVTGYDGAGKIAGLIPNSSALVKPVRPERLARELARGR